MGVLKGNSEHLELCGPLLRPTANVMQIHYDSNFFFKYQS